MNYPAHLSIGIGVGAVTGVLTHSDLIPITLITLGSSFGSLIPDLDTKGKLSKKMPITGFFIRLLTTHRKQTHSLLLNTLVLGALFFLSNLLLSSSYQMLADAFLLGIAVGIASHLFLDSTTKSGIPLFYPLTAKRFGLKWFTTGGVGDTFFFFLGGVMSVGAIVYFAWMTDLITSLEMLKKVIA